MLDIQGYAILFLVCLLSDLMVRALLTRYRIKVPRPPGPSLALPVIEHFHLIGSKPFQSFHNLSLRYGPLHQLYLGSVPCVLVSSAEFLQSHDIAYSDRPQPSNADYLTYGSADLAFSPYGPYWKFMKKLCMIKLLGCQTLDKFFPVMRDGRDVFLHKLLGKARAGEVVDVKEESVKLTNRIATTIIMRRGMLIKRERLDAMKLIGSFNFSDYIWFCKNLDLQGFNKKVKAGRGKLDFIMERIVKAREEARSKGDAENDLLDILLDLTEDEKEEMRLTRENVKAIILDIFGGGTDTISGAFVWTVAELINQPSTMEKARHKIDSVVGKDRVVEESDIAKLPYLQAIVKETLRLHPPGFNLSIEYLQKIAILEVTLFLQRHNYW